MATDTQWPSEDEDFDAIVDSKSTKTVAPNLPARKSVAVVSDDDTPGGETETIAPDTKPDAADETPKSKPDEPEPAVSDETPETPVAPHRDLEEGSVSPEIEAEAAQLAAAEDASVADIPLTAAPGKKSSMGRLALEIILVMALAGLGYMAIAQSSKNKDLAADNASLKKQVATLNANPQLAIQKQTDDLISKVSALMQLPAGETPTVASVSDAAAAKKQSAFFNNAQNGDKVLMYVKAGEAILYRPSTNKIVLVAPLTFSGTPTAATPAKTTTR